MGISKSRKSFLGSLSWYLLLDVVAHRSRQEHSVSKHYIYLLAFQYWSYFLTLFHSNNESQVKSVACVTPPHCRLSCCTYAARRSCRCMKIIFCWKCCFYFLWSVQNMPTWGSQVPGPRKVSSSRLYVCSRKTGRPMGMPSFGKYPKSCGGNTGKSMVRLSQAWLSTASGPPSASLSTSGIYWVFIPSVRESKENDKAMGLPVL